MGDKTAIEWTDATWNPIRGTRGRWSCVKVSEGCKHCYAERLNVRFGGPEYRVGADELRLDEEILAQPLRWRRPRRIFVCSMTDLFEERVKEEWIDRIFNVMANARQHTFQVLTKHAGRMAEACRHLPSADGQPEGWPLPNVWLGVSVENQARADERIPWLLKTPAAVRFLSVEPLLGPVELSKWMWALDPPPRQGYPTHKGPDWVIVGGESGGPPERALVMQMGTALPDFDPRRQPWVPKPGRIGWVRDIRDQCLAAGVPFFFKQWAGPTPKSGGRLLDGKEWSEWP